MPRGFIQALIGFRLGSEKVPLWVRITDNILLHHITCTAHVCYN